jgi:hypothetical protein
MHFQPSYHIWLHNPWQGTLIFLILSRIWDFVTNNNGIWIGLLDLLTHRLQLQPIITAHNPWLPKTRTIPYWTTSVFSSTVIDLVLIYESVTCSASVVRWLTQPQLNNELLKNAERRIPAYSHECTELTSRRTEYRLSSQTLPLLFCFIRCHGNVLTNRCLAMVILRVYSL